MFIDSACCVFTYHGSGTNHQILEDQWLMSTAVLKFVSVLARNSSAPNGAVRSDAINFALFHRSREMTFWFVFVHPCLESLHIITWLPSMHGVHVNIELYNVQSAICLYYVFLHMLIIYTKYDKQVCKLPTCHGSYSLGGIYGNGSFCNAIFELAAISIYI